MEEFLKELTELSLKHKIVISSLGSHGYDSYVTLNACNDDLKGRYVQCNVSHDEIQWVDL